MDRLYTHTYNEHFSDRGHGAARWGRARRCAAFLVAAVLLLLLPACSDDEPAGDATDGSKGTVTVLLPVEGLGDNGFYDNLMTGVFEFADSAGVSLRMLYPDNLEDAENMYREWLSANGGSDNSLLVLAVQAHADFVRRQPPVLTGKGSGVIVVDADSAALPTAGVSPVYIDRYAACYLAGAMCCQLSTITLLANPSRQFVKESAQGFADGYAAFTDGRSELFEDDLTHETVVLSTDDRGFDLPDSAYNFAISHTEEVETIVFPVIGGSAAGVYNALENDVYSVTLAVGMEGDMGSRCSRVPFSVVYNVGNSLRALLHDWSTTGTLPARTDLTLDNGGISFPVNDDIFYTKTYGPWIWQVYWFAEADYYRRAYERYRSLVPRSPYRVVL